MEPVAEAEVRVNEGLARQRFFELRAQLADVDVDGALLLAEGTVPDDRVELLAAHDPATTPREGREQVQLADGEREGPPVREREELGRPDLEPALPQDFVRRRFHPSPSFSEKRAKSVT